MGKIVIGIIVVFAAIAIRSVACDSRVGRARHDMGVLADLSSGKARPGSHP